MQGLSLKESIQIKYDKEYIYDRLERLFFIDSEIPGRFEDGSKIMEFFWEPADSETIRNIIFEVKRLIYRYEKNLNVTAISAGFIPINGTELILLIEIEYTLKIDPNAKEVLTFSKIRDKKD